jgi:hypothetical protein
MDNGSRPWAAHARQVLGGLCLGGAILLMVLDAIFTHYSTDTIQIGLLLGTGLVLLGVEAGRKLFPG